MPNSDPRLERTPPAMGNTAPVKKGGAAAAVLAILAGIYAVEGGYVNDPKDRGGATNYGVTESVARAAGYRGDMRYFPKHCDGPTHACADAIYVRDYIERPGFMPVIEIEPAVGTELVDTGVNMGPSRPTRWFQESLNELGQRVPVDSRIDAGDLAAYRALQARRGAVGACVLMLDRLDRKQEAKYRAIVSANPSQDRFLRGWLNHRVGNVDRKTCGQGA